MGEGRETLYDDQNSDYLPLKNTIFTKIALLIL